MCGTAFYAIKCLKYAFTSCTTWAIIDVACGTQDFPTVMPILYSGCILMTNKNKGQNDKNIWSIYMPDLN